MNLILTGGLKTALKLAHNIANESNKWVGVWKHPDVDDCFCVERQGIPSIHKWVGYDECGYFVVYPKGKLA